MTPEPDCTELSCWPENNEPDDTDRANTCTTEGDTFLKSSIVACSLAARSPRGVMVRGADAENHSAVRYGSATQKVASSKPHAIAKRRKRMGTLFPPCIAHGRAHPSVLPGTDAPPGYRRRFQPAGTRLGSWNRRAGSGTVGGVMWRGRWRVFGLKLRQGRIDLVKFVLDLGQMLGPDLVPSVEQRSLPLKKFGDITHDNSEASPPEDV